MNIIDLPINDITPYARNPRKNDKAVVKVQASIKEFGFQQPIVVDKDNVIIVGHTRWEAAKKLKMKTVPVQVASNLSPEQAKAYRLMDNRSNEEAEWDDEMLRLELEELDGLIDLSLTGFEQDEIDQLDKPQTPTGQEDDLPDVPLTKDVVSREGDIWTLGRHKVICGDSTDPRVYERLMGDELADAIWTDPPYTTGLLSVRSSDSG